MKRLVIIVLFFAAAFGLFIQNQRLREESAQKTQALCALSGIIHETWMQDSITFDNNIRTTEAFQYADSLFCGDWEDTFLNW